MEGLIRRGQENLMTLGGGGAVKVLRPYVMRSGNVGFSQVSGVRWEMNIVTKKLAMEGVGDEGTLLEAQGLEVNGHLLLQDAELGSELIVFLGARMGKGAT